MFFHICAFVSGDLINFVLVSVLRLLFRRPYAKIRPLRGSASVDCRWVGEVPVASVYYFVGRGFPPILLRVLPTSGSVLRPARQDCLLFISGGYYSVLRLFPFAKVCWPRGASREM